MEKIFKFIWLKILSDSLKVMGGKMDKIRLIDAINSSKLDYNDIYDKVNVIKKKKSNFNIESYNEIVYLQMYIYHLKNGINTLSKNGNIPELIPKRISYEQFKIELEKYKNEIEAYISKITELNMQLNKNEEKINNLNKNSLIHNARGAGRKAKFTDDQVDEIRRLREDGNTIKEIAKRYNCSVGLIHKLINEKWRGGKIMDIAHKICL